MTKFKCLSFIAIQLTIVGSTYAQATVKDSLILPTIADAYVYGSAAGPNGRNYGASTNLQIANPSATSAYKQMVFLKFDLHNLANSLHNGNQTAIIDSVKLSPYFTSLTGTGNGNDSLKLFGTKANANNATANSWIEGTLNGAAPTDNSLTWLNMPDTTPLITGYKYNLPTGGNAIKQYLWFPDIKNSSIWQNATAANSDSLVSTVLFSNIISTATIIASKESGAGYTAHLVIYYHYTSESTTPVNFAPLVLTPNKSAGNITVNWSTYTESNTSYFSVLRSLNGVTYTSIDSLPAAGTSNNKMNYHIIDKNPNYGLNYYKIKGTDLDGSTYYSPVASFNFAKNVTGVSIFPNPVTAGGTVSIQLESSKSSKIKIALTNMSGTVVKTGEIAVVSGTNILPVSTASLAAGIYNIAIMENNSLLKTEKLLVK